MHVYKFRILSEEQEDFVRDVEILASQSFETFHQFLLSLFELNSQELASFSICNGRWFKQCEITLIDMKFEDEDEMDDDDDDKKEAKMKTYLMSDSRLRDFVDDPHQRMIYEYDFLQLQTFFLELIKILPAEEGVSYPRCVRSEGALPRKPGPGLGVAGMDDALIGDLNGEDIDETFLEGLDDNFVANLDDGYEIEMDSSVEMNSEEPFDGNFEESGK